MQTLPSLQLVGPPGAQLPPLQVSPVVQALPSLHGAVLFTCWQPVSPSQLSSVQPFPSSQLIVDPLTQVPPLQVSPVVQTLPSSQGAVLLVCWQPSC